MGLVFALFLILAFLVIGFYDLMQTLGAEPMFRTNSAPKLRTATNAGPAALPTSSAPALPSAQLPPIESPAKPVSSSELSTLGEEGAPRP